MAEVDAQAYAVTAANAAAGASNSVETQQPGGSGALRQTMVLGDPTTRANMAKVGAGGDQYMSVGSPNSVARGIFEFINPYGSMRVTNEPVPVFFDPFDGNVIDTTNRWTTAGTQVPTQTGGNLSVQATVGASVANNSQLISQPTFSSPGLAFGVFGMTMTLEAASSTTNVHRFWGKGQVTSYAYTTPVTDGVGFEVTGVGELQCVVYIGGTKYVANSTNGANISANSGNMTFTNYGANLTWQGGIHRYAVMYRSDIIYWFVEGSEVPVAAASYAIPNVQALPLRIASITNNAATSTAYTMTLGAIAVSDSSSQVHQIGDGTYPWRKVSVTAAGALNVAQSDFAFSGNVTTLNANLLTGVATANSTVASTQLQGISTATIQVTGAWTGTLTPQVSVDGNNWVNMSNTSLINVFNNAYSGTIPSASQSVYQADIAGVPYFRVTASAAITGTAAVSIRLTNATGLVGLDNPLPPGANNVGAVSLTPTATSTGGWTPYFANALVAPAGGVTVSGAAGRFGGYMLQNLTAAPAYLQVFDTTAAVTLGTTVPTFVIPIPANATAANGLAANVEFTVGINLANGLKVAATTTSTGATAVTTGLTGVILYK